MNKENKEIITEELKKFKWSIEVLKYKIIFKEDNTKKEIHYLKQEDKYIFINIKQLPFAVLNYINVYVYMIDIKLEEAKQFTNELQ